MPAELTGRWGLVGLSVLVHLAVFTVFIVSTQVRTRPQASLSQGAFIAFIVALYTEMYGFPLTVYLLSPLVPFTPLVLYPPPTALRMLGGALIFAGFLLIYFGWKQVYHARGALVTEGLYGLMRHPQYVGLWLLTLGQLVQWPTVLALLLWPAVVVLYRNLALAEERALLARFPREYAAYCRRVPRFMPRWPGWHLNVGYHR